MKSWEENESYCLIGPFTLDRYNYIPINGNNISISHNFPKGLGYESQYLDERLNDISSSKIFNYLIFDFTSLLSFDQLCTLDSIK